MERVRESLVLDPDFEARIVNHLIQIETWERVHNSFDSDLNNGL